MSEVFNYVVVIKGIDGIPLRTTSLGARELMKSFHGEPDMEKLLLDAVDSGTPFKNSLISINALFPRPKKKVAVETTTNRKTVKKTKKASRR